MKYKFKHWWWYFYPPKRYYIDKAILEISASNLANQATTENLADEFISKYYK